MKKGVVITLVVMALIVGGAIVLSKNDSQGLASVNGDQETVELPENPEYYWGETCKYCANVAEFLDGWQHADKANIQKFEVYNERANAVKMQKRAVSCGLNARNVGVPFLFTTEGECIIGDVPIIDHLKETFGE